MNFIGSVKGRIHFIFSITNQRCFSPLVKRKKVAIIKKTTLILSECSERLQTVCQVKTVPLQGNAVLGTNSIPIFSPVGIMPLYLQTLCHGNVQEGLKQLRNALPYYVFWTTWKLLSNLYNNNNKKKTSWGLWITCFSVWLDMKSRLITFWNS